MGMIKLPKESILYYKDNVDEIFETGFLSEGKWNSKLGEFIKEMTGAKMVVPTSSNGSGMVALLSLYRYYKGRKKVLIQSNTMYGVKTMVPAGGCELAGFINSRLESLMPGVEDVKNAISKFSVSQKKELIILLSHIGGIINPEIKEIAEICKNEGIILLEDCAHSFGSTLYGHHSGLFGDAGVYSFYATKAIPVGEGGAIVTNDEEIGQMVFDFSIYDRFKQKLEIGFNNRVSEPQALLAYSVVKEWKQIINNKTEIAKKYIEICDKLNINFISQNNNGQSGNYYKFTIINKEFTMNDFLPRLKTKTSPVYDYSIGVNNELANHHYCLPIWYGQDDEITDKVINELISCF